MTTTEASKEGSNRDVKLTVSEIHTDTLSGASTKRNELLFRSFDGSFVAEPAVGIESVRVRKDGGVAVH